jgi:hypothetical protein
LEEDALPAFVEEGLKTVEDLTKFACLDPAIRDSFIRAVQKTGRGAGRLSPRRKRRRRGESPVRFRRSV